MAPFSLTELRVLAGLAEGETLASIGAALYLGQPTVSRTLHAAEQKAGLPLVAREGRRLALTPAGAEVARAAQTIVAQMRELDTLLAAMRAGTGGPVRLLATVTPASYVLPAVIGEFIQAFPAARINLEVVNADQVWPTFMGERYDLAVVGQTAPPPGVRLEWLYDDPIVFFAAPGSPLAGREQVSLDDLRGETVIGPFAQASWARIFQELSRRGFSIPRQMDLRAAEGVKRLVEVGGGVGVLFGSALKRELAEGRLRALRVAEPVLAQGFCLARRDSVPVTPVARALREFLLSHLRAEAAAPR
ncbi:MAG TPA: LysR family transcriptional regulator [Chloroflexota bacterium]|nr:LysR family transcriptional regulator [Chloroflexota bacterium]